MKLLHAGLLAICLISLLTSAHGQIIVTPPTKAAVALDRDWETQMKGGDATMKDLAVLLLPYAKASRDPSSSTNLTIYKGVTYLMPYKTARKTLGLQDGIVSKNKLACPGFPKDSFFHYSFNGLFEGNYRRMCIVVDKADQVVCIQLVSENPIKDKVHSFAYYSSDYNYNDWYTYDFVNARSKAIKSYRVRHDMSRYTDYGNAEIVSYDNSTPRLLRIDSILLPSEGHAIEATRWYLPMHLAGLILQCVKHVAPESKMLK